MANKPTCAIFDLDNCLSHDEWRLKYINKGADNYRLMYLDYHERCELDNLSNRRFFDRARFLHDRVVIFTGRPVEFRVKTERWLDHRQLHVDQVFMRGVSDYRSSVDLKRDMLEKLSATHNIITAYDDRPDICSMYREQGIKSVQRLYCYKEIGRD